MRGCIGAGIILVIGLLIGSRAWALGLDPAFPGSLLGPRRAIAADECKACGICLRLGCPAIEGGGKGVKPVVNELLCNGCGMCQQVCRFGAVKNVEVSQ